MIPPKIPLKDDSCRRSSQDSSGRIEGDSSRRNQGIQGQDNAHNSPTKVKKGGKSKEAADRDATALAAGWLVLNQYTTICRAAGIPFVTVLTRYALQRTLMFRKDPPLLFCSSRCACFVPPNSFPGAQRGPRRCFYRHSCIP